jgi:hypothetical protein
MSGFARAFWRLWSAVFRRKPLRLPDVILHDPDALKAQDLDDPLRDPAARGRIGEAIGDQSKRAKPTSTPR